MPSKSKIVGPLMHTERRNDGRRRLIRNLVVEVEGEKLIVPKDTVSDFSSIPWIGRLLVHWSKVDIAGVVHDYLYKKGNTTRKKADRIWKLVAVSGKHHASRLQAFVCWVALRAFGWIAWNRYREEAKKG